MHTKFQESVLIFLHNLNLNHGRRHWVYFWCSFTNSVFGMESFASIQARVASQCSIQTSVSGRHHASDWKPTSRHATIARNVPVERYGANILLVPGADAVAAVQSFYARCANLTVSKMPRCCTYMIHFQHFNWTTAFEKYFSDHDHFTSLLMEQKQWTSQ